MKKLREQLACSICFKDLREEFITKVKRKNDKSVSAVFKQLEFKRKTSLDKGESTPKKEPKPKKKQAFSMQHLDLVEHEETEVAFKRNRNGKARRQTEKLSGFHTNNRLLDLSEIQEQESPRKDSQSVTPLGEIAFQKNFGLEPLKSPKLTPSQKKLELGDRFARKASFHPGVKN